MYPSTLIITSGSSDSSNQINLLLQKIGHNSLTNNPDLFIINADSGWGIEVVRQIKNFLSRKPFGHQSKLVLIYEAHNLGIEAQNALLKVLEEPGDNNYFILTSISASFVLPTILSRCQLIKITPSTRPVADDLIRPSGIISTDLKLSDAIAAEKTQVVPFLNNQLSLYRQRLVDNPSSENLGMINKILTCLSMIKANVDPKSALDYLFLA